MTKDVVEAMHVDLPDKYRQWAALYVLDSLTASERREYELHLSQCTRCDADVAELAGLPALLDVLTIEEAQSIAKSASQRTR